ncbi:MAG: methionine--tRNA ligase subunit beta [Phycisphaerae bacterium]
MDETPGKPQINFDDFAKLDLRVGRVVECTLHPNADKLLLIKVDLGSEQRQIIAGVRAWYEPEQLVGRDIVVVANLAPRMMRGLESQGMMLAASTDDRSRIVILSPAEPLPPGSVVS